MTVRANMTVTATMKVEAFDEKTLQEAKAWMKDVMEDCYDNFHGDIHGQGRIKFKFEFTDIEKVEDR